MTSSTSNPIRCAETIYLDFDGHHSVNNSWNHDIVFPHGTARTTRRVLRFRERVHHQALAEVVEDFVIFDNVNVTTKDPGIDAPSDPTAQTPTSASESS